MHCLVTRGSDGLLIETKALFHPQLVAPVLAEAMAVKEALSWRDSVRGERIMVESDCLVVVQAIRSTSTPMRSHMHFGSVIKECLHYLWIDILFLKFCFPFCTITRFTLHACVASTLEEPVQIIRQSVVECKL